MFPFPSQSSSSTSRNLQHSHHPSRSTRHKQSLLLRFLPIIAGILLYFGVFWLPLWSRAHRISPQSAAAISMTASLHTDSFFTPLRHNTPISKQTHGQGIPATVASTSSYFRQYYHHANKNHSIYFVHIGKSGGETVKSILEFGCHARVNLERKLTCFKNLPDSQLSKVVRGYLHCLEQSRSSIAPREATAFLFTLRHPLDRTMSWFHYVHPQHCQLNQTQTRSSSRQNCMALDNVQTHPDGWLAQFFHDCQFTTMARWADALLLELQSTSTTNSNNHNNPCYTLARTSLLGGPSHIGSMEQVPLASHLISNIRVNNEATAHRFPQTPVIIVRTESLWQDLQELDRLLGGSGEFGGKAVENVVMNAKRSDIKSTAEGLSKRQTQLLCCGLQQELLAYKELLEQAVNFSLKEKQTTLQLTLERCYFESWKDVYTCTAEYLLDKNSV